MSRTYLYLAILAGSFLAGWLGHTRWADVDRLKAQIAASEAARETEQANALKQAETLSAYASKLKRESSAAAAARSDLDRLRIHLASPSDSTADTCGAERTRIGVLEQLLSEGAGLVEEGGRHVEQLRADRSALLRGD